MNSTRNENSNPLRYDEEVIYDVALVTGVTYRGQFRDTDGGIPEGWASFDLYEPDRELEPRWIHFNPAHIVSVRVWID